MHRSRSVRWSRGMGWTLAAAAVGILLVGLFIALESAPPGAATSPQAMGPRMVGFGSVTLGSSGAYYTPVGTMTYDFPITAENSLVYGPLLRLAHPLDLSPEQQTRIQAIQQQAQTALRAERQRRTTLQRSKLQALRQTQQLFRSPLPASSPFGQQVNLVVHRVTDPWRQHRMRSLFAEMREESEESAEKMRSMAKRPDAEINALLTEAQRAALPRLLSDMRVFSRLGLVPAERYATLNLSGEQRNRMKALANRIEKEQRQQMMAGPFGTRLSVPGLRTMSPQQRTAHLRKLSMDRRHQFQKMGETRRESRKKARREALAALTPAQRLQIQRPVRPPAR